MAAKGQSSAEKFSRWGITASNIREHLEEMPHVAADLTEMDGLLTQARTLESQQEAIRGQAREVTAQLKELAKSGEKLRSRLRAHLQAKFGPTSEALLKFGFRPRRTPRRKPDPDAPETKPGTPVPAPVPSNP